MAASQGRDYVAIATAYAMAAVKDKKGKRHSKYVRQACQRHLDDMKRSKRDRAWGYYFDDWYAVDVCDFIEKLPHIEGKWDSPTIVLSPWQTFILCCVFGWRRRGDDGRRFEMAYIEVARKNGKSALSSGVALYCLCCDDEPGPQIKCAATTGQQARVVFSVAKKMVERTPALREAFDVEAMANSIVCLESDGSIQPINAKASTQDGLNPHLVILDELHAHKDRDLYDVLRSAAGARSSPLFWIITTAGYNVLGVCFEQRTLVTKILEGVIEADHYFGIIYTLDEDEDEFDERLWIKANPNLGISPKLEKLQAYAVEAKGSPDSAGEFKTKRMNMWTSAKSPWVPMEKWRKCNGPVDLDELVNVPCWGGLDLASTDDTCAFQLIWRVGDRIKTWGRYYLPEAAVTPRTERGNVSYQRWADEGFLTVTPGEVTDYEYIKKDILESVDRFSIQEIAADPHNATMLVSSLTDDGVPMARFIQGGLSYNPAMQEFDRTVKALRLDHAGNPVLSWMASNVVVRRNVNNNLAPDKLHSHEKIDGMCSLFMAIGISIVPDDGPSIYETDDFLM